MYNIQKTPCFLCQSLYHRRHVLSVKVLMALLFLSAMWAAFFKIYPIIQSQYHSYCPPIASPDVDENQTAVDCASFFTPTYDTTAQDQYEFCTPRYALSDADYTELTKNCTWFRDMRGYNRVSVLPEESHFPIAFSIVLYEAVQQAERLLRSIYRPHNVYCIHVDAKASSSVKAAMAAIVSCFPNVLLASRHVAVRWGRFGVLEADVVCIRDLLWYSATWRYFINLTGREMPLRTNLELVRILKAYNNSNDIVGSFEHRDKHWNAFHWDDYGQEATKLRKAPPPHSLRLAKGSAHIIASRAFVDFAIHNRVALDLLDWLRDTFIPDEHYFNTLQFNPQVGAPGAVITSDPDSRTSMTRAKWWSYRGLHRNCSGTWIRDICNFGVGDLHRLVTSPKLFANKFRYENSPVAFDCMEQWHQARSRRGVGEGFDVEVYRAVARSP